MQSLNRTISSLILSSFQISLKKFILIPLRNSPQMPARPHGHVDDPCCPDINGARVKFPVCIFLRSDIRSRSTKASSHVCFLLPSHAETFPVTKVGDFERTMGGEQ